MKVIDKKCNKCEKTKVDAFDDEKDICCGEEKKRVFGYRKYSEFIPGMYSHFGHDDIYLASVDDYRKACKKHNVAQEGGRGLYDRQYK